MERIELKRMGPEQVVSLRVVGRYGEFGEHLERLRAWLRERGAEPMGPPLGVFHSGLFEAPRARKALARYRMRTSGCWTGRPREGWSLPGRPGRCT